MKIGDTSFDDYIKNGKEMPLHPKLLEQYSRFPSKINHLKNIIFYGPSGVGKYTQMLLAIKKYSPSELKYEKKLSITYNKSVYYYKISDIHFEIDMSLLGCQSKLLWNEIYTNIVDIALIKQNKSGIIVCKNFHEIHSDLLDNFYSYMQTMHNSSLNLKFILITEQLSFIPTNILNCCQVISVPRPSRSVYNKCMKIKIKKTINLDEITNIKNVNAIEEQILIPYAIICNKVLAQIRDVNNLNFLLLRDNLYDILIYNLNICDCILYILNSLVSANELNLQNIDETILKTYTFLFYYNNNYRPIYHLENYIVYLISKVHYTNSV
jgi:hypothetical protein